MYSTFIRRRSQERESSVGVPPQPAAQPGSAGKKKGQGGDHDVTGPESIAPSDDIAEPLSGGIEDVGKGWRIPPSKRSSSANVSVQSLSNGVGVYTLGVYWLPLSYVDDLVYFEGAASNGCKQVGTMYHGKENMFTPPRGPTPTVA